MKYYSRKRIVLSIVAAVIFFVIVASIIEASNPSGYYYGETTDPFIPALIAGIALIAILLPKIWWNFVLDRIREISKAIKDND